MYYNGKRNGISVQQFMEEVHASMKMKYSSTNINFEKDKEQALLLQQFFQDLKIRAAGGTTNFFDVAIIDQILTDFRENSFMSQQFQIKNLFKASGRMGGFAFERQLAAIIETVMNEVSEDDFEFDKNQVLIGAQQGNVGLNGLDLSDEAVQKFLKKIGTKTQKYVENEAKESKMKEYYLPEVSGKIDVKGYVIQIRSNANPGLIAIYNLLKDATFSAKNYNSMTFDEKTKTFIEAQGRDVLHLGNSNILRSIYGSLQSLSIDSKTATSAIFAGYNAIKKGNDSVAQHFYHLRSMYELMGTGITYNGSSFGNVRFLIFNDPSGNIYVKSTAELFSEMIEESLDSRGKWTRSITISKSKFY